MRLIVEAWGGAGETHALRAMFEARKRVFVDLLGWDLPVLDNRYEIDQFDDASARYLVLLDDEGCHRASARLLPTTEAHILGSLFSELCNGELPRGETIFEITRFCLDRRQSASERRYARNQLVSAIVDLALSSGITSFTAVADLAWFQQILAFGWRCRALGLPRAYGSSTLVGLRIEIDERTIAEMTRAGVYTAGVGAAAPTPIAAVAA